MIAGPVFSSPDGSFSLQFPNPTSKLGQFTVQARATNFKGSTLSPVVNFTIKAPGPDTPPNLTMLPADDSGVKGDNITNVVSPHFTGVTDPGVTVELLDGTGQSFAGPITTPATPSPVRSASSSPTEPRPTGQFTIEAKATNAAGSTLGNSAHVHDRYRGADLVPTLNIDPNDDSGIMGDAITNVRKPHFIGTVTDGQRQRHHPALPGRRQRQPDGPGAVADDRRRQRQLLVPVAPVAQRRHRFPSW